MINHGANLKIIVSTTQFIVVITESETYYNRVCGLFHILNALDKMII